MIQIRFFLRDAAMRVSQEFKEKTVL